MRSNSQGRTHKPSKPVSALNPDPTICHQELKAWLQSVPRPKPGEATIAELAWWLAPHVLAQGVYRVYLMALAEGLIPGWSLFLRSIASQFPPTRTKSARRIHVSRAFVLWMVREEQRVLRARILDAWYRLAQRPPQQPASAQHRDWTRIGYEQAIADIKAGDRARLADFLRLFPALGTVEPIATVLRHALCERKGRNLLRWPSGDSTIHPHALPHMASVIYLCLNRELLDLHARRVLTAGQLLARLEENGVDSWSDVETFRRWLRRTYKDLLAYHPT